MTGSPPSVATRSGLSGDPALNSMTEVPVMPVSANRALMSFLIGTWPSTRTPASTLRGSRGSSSSAVTSPIFIPLYWTSLPMDKPLTASLKITV